MEPTVISKHKTRKNARKLAARVEEAVGFWQTAGASARDGYYARAEQRFDLTAPLPRWAREFRAERAKRTPFAWCVRAYPAKPEPEVQQAIDRFKSVQS